MADLDDFFAKKDKKKSKTKKFLTQDELREKLEDNSKKAVVEPVKKFQENSENGAGNNTETQSKDDEEWKEIQEEKKDYSNLKIGQLSLNDNNNYDDDSDLDGEDGEEGGERSSTVDPWKKGETPAAEPAQQIQESAKPAASASKLYVSPALRAAQNAPMRPSKLRSSTAPDISNEDFFPTLANARPEEQRKKKNEPAFEEVRHGGRVQHIKPNAQQLKTDEVVNRFRSLEETDS